MSAVNQAMKKAKAHQRYYTSTGEPCVGVSTVLAMKSKPYLVTWANKLGLDGYEVNKWVDGLARIGTLVHYLVECDIKGTEPDLMDYTPREIESARKSFEKWVAWKKDRDFKLIASELQLASDSMKFGGTCDVYCELDGKKCVLDIKTSKSCYSEHRTQVVAYKTLLIENGYDVDECRIIRIGRDENEGFDDILVASHHLHWELFKALLAVYWADKNLQNAGG